MRKKWILIMVLLMVTSAMCQVACGSDDDTKEPTATTTMQAIEPTTEPTPEIAPESTNERKTPITWSYNVNYEDENTVWTYTLACQEVKNNVESYVVEITYDMPPFRTSGGIEIDMIGMTDYINITTLDRVADIARTKALGTIDIDSESTYTYDIDHGQPFSEGMAYQYEVFTHLEPPLSPDISGTNKMEVAGIEEVTVPAGTFNCFKIIHTRIPVNGEDTVPKLLREEYWAADLQLLGPVKVIELGNWDAIETRELISMETLDMPLPSLPDCTDSEETAKSTTIPTPETTAKPTPTAPVATVEPPEAAMTIEGPTLEYSPMVSGTNFYIDGTYVWTDYAYDDRGANTQGGNLTNPATAGGDATYPAWAEPGNAADLIQLQIGIQEDDLLIRAILETLVNIDVPIVGVAFDTDDNPATGSFLLPGDTWPADGPLGIEELVVISSDGSTLWSHNDSVWATSGSFDAVVDAESNLIEAIVPHEILDIPERGTWRAFCVLGIRNNEGGSWLDGSEQIYDLAFVGDEPEYGWQDRRQADILSGELASANAAATIDFDMITSGTTRVANPMAPGFHTYMYRSHLGLGEGIVTRSDGTHEFNGPYQPYLVYIPDLVSQGRPMTVFLHGANGNHLGSVYNFPDGNYIGTGRMLSEELYIIEPFAVDGIDFPPNVITVYPLARGETLSYTGIAEQDVLDVTDDAIRRLGTDPDRVALSGASMGGMGTFRVGALYPDRWAVAIPIVGYARDSFDLLENFINLPVRQINGFIDPLVDYVPAAQTAERLHELGIDHRFWLLYERGHEGGGFVYQCVYDQAQEYVRNENPVHIIYRVDPSKFMVDETTGLNLRYDSAFWVSVIEVNDESTFCQVDVMSEALPRWERDLVEIDAEYNNLDGGRNLCGLSPVMQPTKDTWHELSWIVSKDAPLPEANVLTATLQNLAMVTFDLKRAGIGSGEEVSIGIATDSPCAVTLTGLDYEQNIILDGAEVISANHEGIATIEIPAGDHEVTVHD